MRRTFQTTKTKTEEILKKAFKKMIFGLHNEWLISTETFGDAEKSMRKLKTEEIILWYDNQGANKKIEPGSSHMTEVLGNFLSCASSMIDYADSKGTNINKSLDTPVLAYGRSKLTFIKLSETIAMNAQKKFKGQNVITMKDGKPIIALAENVLEKIDAIHKRNPIVVQNRIKNIG